MNIHGFNRVLIQAVPTTISIFGGRERRMAHHPIIGGQNFMDQLGSLTQLMKSGICTSSVRNNPT
jgi:hypothetical protein